MIRKSDEKTISKKGFIGKLARRTKLPCTIVEQIFRESLDLMVSELKSGNKLEFRGTFILGTKVQDSRVAQNPKTLEKVTIPERRVVYFKKGERLKGLEYAPGEDSIIVGQI